MNINIAILTYAIDESTRELCTRSSTRVLIRVLLLPALYLSVLEYGHIVRIAILRIFVYFHPGCTLRYRY